MGQQLLNRNAAQLEQTTDRILDQIVWARSTRGDAYGNFSDRQPIASLNLLVCLANRGTYSGWMMRPGRWPDLSDRVVAEAG